MTITHAIVKSVRGCNISCRYCYVDQYGFGANKIQMMSDDMLELLFKRTSEHVNEQNIDRFTFYWHGGEPLLQPMKFYESVRKYSDYYLPNTRVVHHLQTNATRVSREYARLLKDIGITVSVSLDGPPEVNDVLRVDNAGRGTSSRVLRGLEILNAEGHKTQILCVITPEAIGRGAELYSYFRSLGAEWMDFLLPHASAHHSTISLLGMPTQDDYANFFVDVYHKWMEEANSHVCVRRLRDYTQLILGAPPDACIFSDDCSYIVTVLPDGSIYPCDDLLYTYKTPLGNLANSTFNDIIKHDTLCGLCKNSPLLFGKECLSCDYFDVCRGGCTNYRADGKGAFTNTYYYCRMSKLLIDHIKDDLLQRLVDSGIKINNKTGSATQ